MKKILSIIIALVTFAGIADAQISVKKSEFERAKQVATLGMSWSWLYQQGDSYYLVMKSDNQFDDSFWLKIGTTREECEESVKSLLELCESITDTDIFYLDNGEGDTFDVTRYKMMGVKGLYFRDKGHAGAAYILPANLNKALKWIGKSL